MEKNELLKELSTIFEEVLDLQNLKLNETTSANDIAEWDSVSHLILLHSIEEKYKIKFELDEIIHFRNVGDICNCILVKTK